MKPSILEINNNQIFTCKMCSKNGKGKKYHMISSFTETEVSPICRTCAVREYYGTKGTSGKKYAPDKIIRKLFGVEGYE